MQDKLKELATKMIEVSEDKEKYMLIKNILEDKNCFLKMEIETAFSILRDLNIEEKHLEDTYNELTKL